MRTSAIAGVFVLSEKIPPDDARDQPAPFLMIDRDLTLDSQNKCKKSAKRLHLR
jgi:hypothetical protein